MEKRKERGRGAVSNEGSRFDQERREAFDDGWDIEEEQKPLKREVIIDTTRTLLARNQSPDIHFDRSINPYRGCEHGCIYCFARPTHAYLGHSPGLDFETKIHVKPDAVKLLARELAKPSYVCKPIAMGTNTDPYQPIEKEQKIMRGILEYLLERRHPVSIVTKGSLILRDLDLLTEFARLDLIFVGISVTTLNNRLHRQMEPRAAAPARRLAMVKALSEGGVPVSVLCAPMIPRLNDMELEAIMEAAKDAGARSANYILLRMPHEIKDLFREWLDEHYPDRKDKVIRYIRETQGGKDYHSEFGERHLGMGVYAELIKKRHAVAKKRLGFEKQHLHLRTDLFRPPPLDPRQMELF